MKNSEHFGASLESALMKKPKAVQHAIDKLLCERSLRNFVDVFWHEIEPATQLVPGWPLDAICEHLEAVSRGDIQRLVLNVCPGFMKSLLVSVFWPAFEWGPLNRPTLRYITTSYSQNLTLRDNIRFKNIITSDLYKSMWGDRFSPSEDQFTKTKIANTRSGWKIASSVGGTVTGERGNRFICDDPNAVNEAESEPTRNQTNTWFRETVPTRLNNQDKDAIIVVQQRVHELDVTGLILDLGLPYVHFVVPMEYVSKGHCTTVLSHDRYGQPDKIWQDPRGLDDDGERLTGSALDAVDGTLAWPRRYSADAVEKLKATLGPYAYAGQFQQMPSPRGGGIFKSDWWQEWPPADWPAESREKYARKYPDFSYIVASLDPGLTKNEDSDYSALSIWGIWRAPAGVAVQAKLTTDEAGFMRITDAETPKIMLMYAWQRRLDLRGPTEIKPEGLSDEDWNSPYWINERMKDWGLVETVAHFCRLYKVDLLLIENKAGGQHVTTELSRQLSGWDWGIQMVDPGRFDKVSRAHSVVHLFSNGVVYAPLDRAWCDEVVAQAARFPRGKNDDLVDSMTQALQHLRDTRWALRKEESETDFEEALKMPGKTMALYPV